MWIVILLLGMPERDYPLVDRVMLVEVNHFYDEQGRLVFDQVIWYDWDGDRYQIVDWRLLKGVRSDEPVDQEALKKHQAWPHKFPPPVPKWIGGHATPYHDSRLKLWVSSWHDIKYKMAHRVVYAKLFRETWTCYDPELIEREFLPQERRRELRKHEVQQRAQPGVR
jgi:hypothetical protein